jgi:hypothetical protein
LRRKVDRPETVHLPLISTIQPDADGRQALTAENSTFMIPKLRAFASEPAGT